jgi:TM2 domain-containing membrane protein YozV
MDCVNHSGVPAKAYCQNCGKGLCTDCVAAGLSRPAAGGQILCDACITAWQNYQQSFVQPFMAPPPSGPKPGLAAFLGLFPGVGAMYNGQFFKGFVHVAIFAVLISLANHYDIFGLFIAAWIIYQAFEAFHTAKALQDGQPVPDPLGLNEVSNWLNLGGRQQLPGQPQAPVNPGAAYVGQGQPSNQTPYPGSYQGPYAPPVAGVVDPAAPPIPPVPPLYWRRKEPIGAIVLIALGLLFLLEQLDIFHGRLMEFAWPLLLIGLGVWLIVRRVGESQGGPK